MSKWDGRQFQPVSEEERRRFAAGVKLTPNFTDVDGWSSRSNVLRRQYGATRFDLTLGGEHVVVVVHDANPEPWEASDIERDGEKVERVWYADRTPQRVSAEEYRDFLDTLLLRSQRAPM